MYLPWIGIFSLIMASAGSAAAALPQSMSFDCNADSGIVTGIDPATLPLSTAISGTVRPVLGRVHPSMSAAATIKLASQKNFVAIQVAETEPNSGVFEVWARNGDSREEERTPLGKIKLNDTVSFKLERVGNDVLVTAGNQAVTIRQLFLGQPTVGVSCSTGQFVFNDIRLK